MINIPEPWQFNDSYFLQEDHDFQCEQCLDDTDNEYYEYDPHNTHSIILCSQCMAYILSEYNNVDYRMVYPSFEPWINEDCIDE